MFQFYYRERKLQPVVFLPFANHILKMSIFIAVLLFKGKKKTGHDRYIKNKSNFIVF